MRRTTFRHNVTSRRLFSTTYTRLETLELAYTRHEPPKCSSSEHPPIILMHGLFGSQRNNRTMSKALASDLSRPIYSLDLRNHGTSPHHPTHNYAAMAEDVEAFIATNSLPCPTLIGHSMGAKVAMTMALRQPTKYSALIPVDNAPVDAALKSDFGIYMTAMREIEERRPRVAKQSEADKLLQRYESDFGIRAFLLTNLVKGEDGEMRFRIPLGTLTRSLGAMADFPFKDPDVARFEGPTLVVRGTRSHYVADETLPVVGRFFPKFELLDFDCGHWVMSEKFGGFRRGVGEWIRRVVDGND